MHIEKKTLRNIFIGAAACVILYWLLHDTERVKTVLSGAEYDQSRLLQEVAIFADKSNIDEELTRLRSHIAQFGEILKSQSAGRKLDFLVQEFNREANTVCSKSNDIDITNYGLLLKCEIEKIREQIQNIE